MAAEAAIGCVAFIVDVLSDLFRNVHVLFSWTVSEVYEFIIKYSVHIIYKHSAFIIRK